jgi:hypothetical protein
VILDFQFWIKSPQYPLPLGEGEGEGKLANTTLTSILSLQGGRGSFLRVRAGEKVRAKDGRVLDQDVTKTKMKIALAKNDGDCLRSGIFGNPKSEIQNCKGLVELRLVR